MNKREFTPEIIQTKENLLTALRAGDIKTSKYNLLNEEEKLFVEMVVFGDYSAEQAMKSIHGDNYKTGQGNRMCARPNVAEALEELSFKKNKKFMAEISSARDLALRKLTYIMDTTTDESVAVTCARAILDKSEHVTTEKEAKDTINAIQFNIQVAPPAVDVEHPKVNLDEPIIADVKEYKKATQESNILSLDEATNVPEGNGLGYVLNYQGVNNYQSDDE